MCPNQEPHENKAISVVYIITKLELGGAQKICLELFNGLQKSGIQAHLITGSQGTLVNTLEKNNHILFVDSLKREVSMFGIINEIKTFIYLIKQLRKLKKQNPHIITHTHSTKAGILGTWAALMAGIRHRIHTVHGYGFHQHQSKIKWLATYIPELITSFFVTHYICVSSADVKTGIKLLPSFKKKYFLIRAAVDQKTFYIPAHKQSFFPSSNEPFIFGTIACFKPQKNIFDLLNAFKQVHTHNNNTRLEIIGDGILRPEIESWSKQHGLHNIITLHGWQHQVAPIMHFWHAFALSSLWEGLPCSIVEARLLKLPIISYNTGGISDIIINHKNGLLIEQKDWPALAHAMLTLTRDKALYEKLRTYSDKLSNFNTPNMINQHIQLYQNIRTQL